MTISRRLEELANLCHHGVEIGAFERDLRTAAKDAERLEARWSDDEYPVELIFDHARCEDLGVCFVPCFLEADWRGEDLKLGDWYKRDDGKIALKISVPAIHEESP